MSLQSNNVCRGCDASTPHACPDPGANRSQRCCPAGGYCSPARLNNWICSNGAFTLVYSVDSEAAIDVSSHCTNTSCANPRIHCTPTRDAFTCDTCEEHFSQANCTTFTCPASRYCPEGMPLVGAGIPNTTTIRDCPAGAFCETNTTVPAPCPSGAFCPARSSSPTPCVAGTFCPASSASAIACPAGHQCPSSGMAAPVPCPSGTFSRDAGSTSCVGSCGGPWRSNGAGSTHCDGLSPLSIALICVFSLLLLLASVMIVAIFRRRRRAEAARFKVATETALRDQLEAAERAQAQAAFAAAQRQWEAKQAQAHQEAIAFQIESARLAHAEACESMRAQIHTRWLREVTFDLTHAAVIHAAFPVEAHPLMIGAPPAYSSSAAAAGEISPCLRSSPASPADLSAYLSFLSSVFQSALQSASLQPLVSLLVREPQRVSPVDVHAVLVNGLRPLIAEQSLCFARARATRSTGEDLCISQGDAEASIAALLTAEIVIHARALYDRVTTARSDASLLPGRL